MSYKPSCPHLIKRRFVNAMSSPFSCSQLGSRRSPILCLFLHAPLPSTFAYSTISAPPSARPRLVSPRFALNSPPPRRRCTLRILARGSFSHRRRAAPRIGDPSEHSARLGFPPIIRATVIYSFAEAAWFNRTPYMTLFVTQLRSNSIGKSITRPVSCPRFIRALQALKLSH